MASRHALTVEHITRLGDDQAPDWPTGRGWKVTVEGRPATVLDSKIATHGVHGGAKAALVGFVLAMRGGAGNPYVP